MNWFERYGIPGLYCVSLIAGWIWAISPQVESLDSQPGLWALLVAISLPLGYVISILGQWCYLQWAWPRIGLHREAMIREYRVERRLIAKSGENAEASDDEAIIEARTLLLTSRPSTLERDHSVDVQSFIRNWIARRMDVIAINQSIIVATIIALIVAIVVIWITPKLEFAWSWGELALGFTCVIVLWIMCVSRRTLGRQVVEVIAGVYREYSDDQEEPQEPDQP